MVRCGMLVDIVKWIDTKIGNYLEDFKDVYVNLHLLALYFSLAL